MLDLQAEGMLADVPVRVVPEDGNRAGKGERERET